MDQTAHPRSDQSLHCLRTESLHNVELAIQDKKSVLRLCGIAWPRSEHRLKDRVSFGAKFIRYYVFCRNGSDYVS